MGKPGHIGSGQAAGRTFNLSMVQMRILFQIYHSLALAADKIGDPFVIASATKLKELLFKIPRSETCNPMNDLPAESVYDLSVLY